MLLESSELLIFFLNLSEPLINSCSVHKYCSKSLFFLGEKEKKKSFLCFLYVLTETWVWKEAQTPNI